MDWIVTLANGEQFVVVDQPDEDFAWAAATQVRYDHFHMGPESEVTSVWSQDE